MAPLDLKELDKACCALLAEEKGDLTKARQRMKALLQSQPILTGSLVPEGPVRLN